MERRLLGNLLAPFRGHFFFNRLKTPQSLIYVEIYLK